MVMISGPTPDNLKPLHLLHKTTVNRYLQLWGYDHARMTRAPVAVRFEANILHRFDETDQPGAQALAEP